MGKDDAFRFHLTGKLLLTGNRFLWDHRERLVISENDIVDVRRIARDNLDCCAIRDVDAAGNDIARIHIPVAGRRKCELARGFGIIDIEVEGSSIPFGSIPNRNGSLIFAGIVFQNQTFALAAVKVVVIRATAGIFVIGRGGLVDSIATAIHHVARLRLNQDKVILIGNGRKIGLGSQDNIVDVGRTAGDNSNGRTSRDFNAAGGFPSCIHIPIACRGERKLVSAFLIVDINGKGSLVIERSIFDGKRRFGGAGHIFQHEPFLFAFIKMAVIGAAAGILVVCSRRLINLIAVAVDHIPCFRFDQLGVRRPAPQRYVINIGGPAGDNLNGCTGRNFYVRRNLSPGVHIPVTRSDKC